MRSPIQKGYTKGFVIQSRYFALMEKGRKAILTRDVSENSSDKHDNVNNCEWYKKFVGSSTAETSIQVLFGVPCY